MLYRYLTVGGHGIARVRYVLGCFMFSLFLMLSVIFLSYMAMWFRNAVFNRRRRERCTPMDFHDCLVVMQVFAKMDERQRMNIPEHCDVTDAIRAL